MKPVIRSTSGLVDALFDTVDRLNAKEIDAETARAVSHTARSIVSVARLELEFRQFAATGGPPLTSIKVPTIEAKA